MENMRNDMDALLETPFYVIDFLPQRVPENSGAHFYDVESYLLSGEKRREMKGRYVNIILKLMCYYRIIIVGKNNTQPIDVENAIGEMIENHSGTLNILFPAENVLLVLDGDSLHFTVYNVPKSMKELMGRIALSEGFFFWEGMD